MTGCEKRITFEVEEAKRGSSKKTWKELDKDGNGLHSKPSDAMDHRKQREMIPGNWSISDAVS